MNMIMIIIIIIIIIILIIPHHNPNKPRIRKGDSLLLQAQRGALASGHWGSPHLPGAVVSHGAGWGRLGVGEASEKMGKS